MRYSGHHVREIVTQIPRTARNIDQLLHVAKLKFHLVTRNAGSVNKSLYPDLFRKK